VSRIPDTHQSLSVAEIGDTTEEQRRKVGIDAAGYALAKGWPGQDLVDVLHMLGVLRTQPGARTDHLGKRVPLSPTEQRRRDADTA
jgi:hypothetical protein